MWVSRLASQVQNRIRGSHQRDQNDHDFHNPSIQVTTTAAVPQDTQANELESEVHDCTMPLLFNLCQRWAWPAIPFRCQTHPAEASAQDLNGDTALHWAVFGNPPLNVVEALLEANPALASMANKEGKIPLHVAASYRACGSVIRALVRAYPEGCGIFDPKSGATALHIMCDRGSSVEGIHAILETDAGAMSTQTTDAQFQQTPLEILNARKNMYEFHSMIVSLKIFNEKRRYKSGVTSGSDYVNQLFESHDQVRFPTDFEFQLERIRKGTFWSSVCALVQSQYKCSALETDADTSCHVLHACVGIPNCPPSLVELAALLHPEQLWEEQDEDGQIPLHIIFARSDWQRFFFDVFHPEATRICNRHGKYPLQVAVESGYLDAWCVEMGLLVASHPPALICLDLDERLYPYVLSKLPGELDSLFQFLQARPQLLSRGAL